MTFHRLALTCAAALLSACSAAAPNIEESPVAPNYRNAPLDLSTPENTAYAMMIAMYRGPPRWWMPCLRKAAPSSV